MLPADVASDVASDVMMAGAASFPSNDIGSRPRFLRGGPNANENVINDPLLPYSLERSCQFDPYPVALTRTQSDVTKALKLGQIYDITLHEHVVRFATINSSGQNSTAWAQGTVFGMEYLWKAFILSFKVLGFGHRTTLRLTPAVNKSWWIVLTCWRVFIASAVLEPAYIDAKIAFGAWHAWPFWGEHSITLNDGQTVTPDPGLSTLYLPVHLSTICAWFWLVKTCIKLEKTDLLARGGEFWNVTSDAHNTESVAVGCDFSSRVNDLDCTGEFATTMRSAKNVFRVAYLLFALCMCLYPLKFTDLPMCPIAICGTQTSLQNATSVWNWNSPPIRFLGSSMLGCIRDIVTYLIGLLVLLVVTLLCTVTATRSQAVVLDFKEQMNTLRHVGDDGLLNRPWAAGNATEDVESAQNRRVSKTDISNLLRRLGKEATSSKGYFGLLALLYVMLLGTFVVLVIHVNFRLWNTSGGLGINYRVVGIIYMLPFPAVGSAGLYSMLRTNSNFSSVHKFMVAMSFDNGFRFLNVEERNSLLVYSSHVPIMKIFGQPLTFHTLGHTVYPFFLAFFAFTNGE